LVRKLGEEATCLDEKTVKTGNISLAQRGCLYILHIVNTQLQRGLQPGEICVICLLWSLLETLRLSEQYLCLLKNKLLLEF